MKTNNAFHHPVQTIYLRISNAPGWLKWSAASIFLLFISLWIYSYIPVSASDLSGYLESRRLYDRNMRLLREAVGEHGSRAAWVEYREISPWIIDATIAVEDKRFYSHSGIDYISLIRAVWQTATHGRIISGASTITMQLARLIYGYPHTISGKVRQSICALRIENTIGKKEILRQYLNRAYFGAGCIGVEAASQRFLGKPNFHVSPAEAAFIAGLPKSPTALNPLKNKKGALERQRVLLNCLVAGGKLSREEYERAIEEPVCVAGGNSHLAAMHFTDFVLSHNPPAGDIVTTLDSDLQNRVEKMVFDHVQSLRSGGLTNAAVVILDNKDGSILSMVGSADYWHPQSGSVNGTVTLRQPGSTLKPFMYALAFERGKSPASMVADVETEYLSGDGDIFVPRNYSHQLSGPVLIRAALGRSLNIPAIRTLNTIGIDNLLNRLLKIGFCSLTGTAEKYGLGLTLGNGEVTLLELAQGYAMLARGGLTCKAKLIQNASVQAPARVFSKDDCFLITDILSDESLRIQAFGSSNPLLFGFPIAVKTGTSTNWRDNWVIGYTPEYTIAVWAGDFEGSTMNRFSGSIGAGPLFHKIVKQLVYGRSVSRIPPSFTPPKGVVRIDVCTISGMSPSEHCPYRSSVFVKKKDVPPAPCTVHRKLRIDKRNGLLASDCCPAKHVKEEVYTILPPLYAQWQADHSDMKPPPTTYSPLCPQNGITADALVITSPRNGDRYLIEPGYDRATQSIALKGQVDPTLPEITWRINGKPVAHAAWPYNAIWRLQKGRHRIEMVGGGRQSDPIDIMVY